MATSLEGFSVTGHEKKNGYQGPLLKEEKGVAKGTPQSGHVKSGLSWPLQS